MGNKYWLFISFFICCSVTVFSQILPGLYADCDKMYSTYRFVTVKGDTAFSEEIGTKKMNVFIFQDRLDTLIRQNDDSYSGNKYVLKQKNGSIYLVEKNTKKKRETPLRIANEMVSVKNGLHNRFAMGNMGIYKRYYLTRQYLLETSQNVDDIVNAFNDLEAKEYLDQQSFLVALQKFETEYLTIRIIIEE